MKNLISKFLNLFKKKSKYEVVPSTPITLRTVVPSVEPETAPIYFIEHEKSVDEIKEDVKAENKKEDIKSKSAKSFKDDAIKKYVATKKIKHKIPVGNLTAEEAKQVLIKAVEDFKEDVKVENKKEDINLPKKKSNSKSKKKPKNK